MSAVPHTRVMANVTIENVTKKFGNVTAVKNLNLQVDDGEFLVVVGPSGCGKTTFLRLLAGLEKVTAGRIYIGDRCVNNLSPKDRNIAMVFQSYALYPHMSVYENMAFSLELQGQKKWQIKSRVEAAARQLGIEKLLHRQPKELSGGQRQRVAVGRAIVREPAVFLMDEPLSNLDAKLRVQARIEISKLHKSLGTTFIYVTHDQVEAMTMGSRIAVMNEGILQQLDSPQNLYNHPKSVFVAGFIGSPAMNFFNVTKVLEADKQYLQAEGFRLEVPQQWQDVASIYPGQPLILGLRPENIYAPQYQSSGVMPASVKAQVEVTEMLGNETILYLKTLAEEAFVARIDPRSSITVGQQVELVFDLNRIHLFERQSEKALV